MNRTNIKVSIITPTYNDEMFIKQTIESVLRQTHTNFELIIIDDKSTDDTLKIINQIKDPRIRVLLNNENRGAAYSRNRGLHEASGEYVAFLDGDDVWHNTKLEQQLDFMINNNYFFSYTEYSLIDEKGNNIGQLITGPKKISHKRFLKVDYIGCLTAMYKRSILPDLQIPNDIVKRNDYALWLKISEKAPCYLLKEELAFYRKRHSGSISSGSKIKLIRYHRELFKKLYSFNSIKCTFFAFRNVFYYIIKRFKYAKKKEGNLK